MTAEASPGRVRARVTGDCPCCGRRISRRMWYCDETWLRVPPSLRMTAYLADAAANRAYDAIRKWLTEHPDVWTGARRDGAIDQSQPAGTDQDGATGAGTP